MVMLAHFEDWPSSPDRRGSARRALRLDIAAPGETGGGQQVTIHDLSLTGVLLETSAGLAAGDKFQVDLPHAGTVEATVVWNSGEFYGCQFSAPISPAALSAALLQGGAPAAQGAGPDAIGDAVADLHNITAQVEKIAAEVERALRRLSARSGRHDQQED